MESIKYNTYITVHKNVAMCTFILSLNEIHYIGEIVIKVYIYIGTAAVFNIFYNTLLTYCSMSGKHFSHKMHRFWSSSSGSSASTSTSPSPSIDPSEFCDATTK